MKKNRLAAWGPESKPNSAADYGLTITDRVGGNVAVGAGYIISLENGWGHPRKTSEKSHPEAFRQKTHEQRQRDPHTRPENELADRLGSLSNSLLH